jgi:hypothetical protein
MKDFTRIRLRLLIAAGTATAILFGCSPKIEPAAVGKWRAANGNDTMEFRTDGSCQGQDQYGRVVSGKFAFVDAEHERCQGGAEWRRTCIDRAKWFGETLPETKVSLEFPSRTSGSW